MHLHKNNIDELLLTDQTMRPLCPMFTPTHSAQLIMNVYGSSFLYLIGSFPIFNTVVGPELNGYISSAVLG
jgi:hypothetical protein